jgi:uncharacterized membrane protein YoaK (UPF0700 family)
VAGVLAAIAGFVDAVGFNRLFGVFPSNQSGNVVFLGMAIGGDSPASGWRCVVSIAGFAVGAAAGFALGPRLPPRRKGPVLLVGELVLLVAVSVLASPFDADELAGGFRGAALVTLGSVAMGLQTEAIRRVAGVGVTTTYQSGSVARIGETVSGALRRPAALLRQGAGLWILVAVLLAYLAGAAVGATAPGQWAWPLALPCGVLAILVVAWSFVPGWFAALDDGLARSFRSDPPGPDRRG